MIDKVQFYVRSILAIYSQDRRRAVSFCSRNLVKITVLICEQNLYPIGFRANARGFRYIVDKLPEPRPKVNIPLMSLSIGEHFLSNYKIRHCNLTRTHIL